MSRDRDFRREAKKRKKRRRISDSFLKKERDNEETDVPVLSEDQVLSGKLIFTFTKDGVYVMPVPPRAQGASH
ncbi:hypothetical protein A3C91_04620 [Candidatus Azambacteria bacterium RIFCSPHIGHO2_02_FULL_52_12]|uniref:Uncharacterized protein n=1 Tax=Candidatus Azambacteria bacterium RIFCSPLOWO2_01_FULL_46_25 TaxID=1797298 RepID=A0A1F5BV46_9BACT|nr:MAG: hypothetical protein A3C91_04620 [Candidatus Azambacteria bacterium RIFCSPHIGHO2_02_FULL_52_12]OGD34484.1 MAG: hypothetical protein A2988_03115 [Candidatus Azambacteria bacterium RIFCSPLOWO2_01_FULL_46_25]OGD37601.1 MAG: hypothetical protein A2850_03600 [Candidatus Azambacteria bacterium RIFCSPHIGHO2_01_FULL_51_74]